MEENKNLAYAVDLMNSGYVPKATKILTLLSKSENIDVRLQAIDYLLSTLDQIKDSEQIISLCDQGITISTKQNKADNLAYFQIKKAIAISVKIGGWKYTRRMFKLSPDWFNFSTEKDEKAYKDLNKKIKRKEDELQQLQKESLNYAEQTDNKQLIGMIYLYRSSIWHNRYAELKVDKLIRTVPILPGGRFKDLLQYKRSDLKMINDYFNKSIADLHTAIQAFTELGDQEMISYCLNNMTNSYIHAYKFSQASSTLKELEKSMKGTNDKQLLKNFEELKSRIKSRNKNIPNYLEEYQDFIAE